MLTADKNALESCILQLNILKSVVEIFFLQGKQILLHLYYRFKQLNTIIIISNAIIISDILLTPGTPFITWMNFNPSMDK